MSFDVTNEEFRIAVELVNQSSRNIFLTGKAGTGKTTFLKHIRANCKKQMAVVAPTGVAAINAGGVTIHSFFQLPLSPFIPDTGFQNFDEKEAINRHDLIKRLKINSDKRKVLRNLELLIIDEISMVRCDTVDAIDTVLRFVRKNPFEAFGGVQVLFIGDMYQLPPVIKEAEWKLLSVAYQGPYFFDSHVIKRDAPLYIEFRKIYRQSEQRFIRLLNEVRNNELTEESVEVLESRFHPSFRRTEHDGYILLTSHNETARNINSSELSKLGGTEYAYKAEVVGEFWENTYPADELLQLKVGAQVMFIKNDSDRAKRFFNGKIGTVSFLSAEKIRVQCEDEEDEIEVVREEWLNVKYSLNKSSQKLEEEQVGAFRQFPLRLAWAITIHKSQGLTFEKAIIDAGQSFAAGQVYVALSRCTSLEGMVLQSRINRRSLMTDPRIAEFSRQAGSAARLEAELADARKHGQEQLAISSFDFSKLFHLVEEIREFLKERQSSFHKQSGPWAEELWTNVHGMVGTSKKFHTWLRSQFLPDVAPANVPGIKERLLRAATHFRGELDKLINALVNCQVETDSKLDAKSFNEKARDLFAELSMKRYLLNDFDGNLDVEHWYARKNAFRVPSFSVNAYSGVRQSTEETAHPILFDRLKKLRDQICLQNNLPVYLVATRASIEEMVKRLPSSADELKRITGFGTAKVEKYGGDFLDIINDYRGEYDVPSVMEELLLPSKKKATREKKPPKPDTRAESFRLYREGLTVAEIAKERNLNIQTIEGHLCRFIAKGEIAIESLVQQEKLLKLLPAVEAFTGESIVPLKEALGPDFSFSEIRMGLAWKEYTTNKQEERR